MASRSALSLLLTSLSWGDMLLWAFSVKKIVRTGKEKCLEVVKIFSVFVSLVISRDLSARSSVAHAYVANNGGALILLTFIGNVNKRQYPKIYSLEFDEIFQNSYYYRTSIKKKQKLNKGVLWHNQYSLDSYFHKYFKNCLLQFGQINFKKWRWLIVGLCKFIRKSNYWILRKPTEFKILSSIFSWQRYKS